MQRLDAAYHSTVLPPFPSCLLCGVVPFCFVFCYFDSRRNSKISLVVAQENARLELLGLQWVLTPNRNASRSADHRALMVLRWTVARPAFEAANPQWRAVSREPVPVGFLSQEMQMQLAIAAASPALVAAQGRQAAIALGMVAPAPAPAPAPQRQCMQMAAAPPRCSAQPASAHRPAPTYGQPSTAEAPPPAYGQPLAANGAPMQLQQQPQPVVHFDESYDQTSFGAPVCGQTAAFDQQQQQLQAGSVYAVVQLQPQPQPQVCYESRTATATDADFRAVLPN